LLGSTGKNIRDIAKRNRISDERLNLTAPAQGQPIDVCVEMETGKGKTLVYLRTLYSLHSVYGWNKFIIVVPSVAIRAGVMGTLADFGEQLTPSRGHGQPALPRPRPTNPAPQSNRLLRHQPTHHHPGMAGPTKRPTSHHPRGRTRYDCEMQFCITSWVMGWWCFKNFL
jgi:hypothetical protein